jgi:uncharacterized repeat protein (TIGR01451 family)
LAVWLLNFSTNLVSLAEGTRQASPNTSAISALLSAPDLNSGSFFNTSEDNRIYFNIKDAAAENLYFGFDWRTYSTTAAPAQTFMYYRILRPDGTVALGPTLWAGTGAGKIDTYAQAVAGPNIAGSVPTGYTPLVFTPTVNGEHWIEIWRGTSATDPTPNTAVAGRAQSPLFDLTVANKTSPFAVQNGRVFSFKWGLVAVDPSTFFVSVLGNAAPIFRAYTDDRLVVQLEFNTGFQPIAYNVSVNSYGVRNSGNRVVDRRSVNDLVSPSLPGGYKVFLNNPDVSLYPVTTDTGNPTFGSPLFDGCAAPYNINYSLPANGDVRLLFDLNGTPGYQAGTTDRILEAFDVLAGNNVISWDGKNGLGQTIANNTSLNMKLTYLRGRFNVPIYDGELNKNGLSITTVFPASVPNPRLYWDDTQLTNLGTTCTATDGQNNLTGAGIDNSLVGSISPAHAWNGNGNPTQIIPAPAVGGNDANTIQCDDFGNVRTINTFGWGQEKEVNTIGVLGCPDLTLTKSVNNSTPTIGSNVTFTVTAQNIGPVTAPNTVVTDVIPSGYTLVSATPSVGTWSAPNWTIGNLAVGATPTLTLVATVRSTGLYTNTASIASGFSDPNPNNNNAFAVVTPRGTGTTLTNICPATTVNLTNQVVITNLPSGATLTWHTATPATSTNKVPNVTSVGAGTYYAAFEDATNNCYSPTTAYNVTIQTCNADLSITKTVNNSTPNVGSNVIFTLSVVNNGSSPATGVTANDVLPSGYTYVSDNGSGAYNSTTGVWTIGNLATSATATLQITATVRMSGNYANTATVSGNQTDPVPGNNTSTNTPIPVPVSDLAITKTDGSATYTPGTPITYTLVVTNSGPSNVTGATIADAIPAAITGVSWTSAVTGNASVSSGATGTGNSLAATVNLTAGAGNSVTFTITGTVSPAATGNLVNTATVTAPAGTTDNNAANNTATDTDTPAPVADLAVTKTDGSATYTPGTPITYTLVVTNSGPSNVTGATLADAVPAAITGVSWTSSVSGNASVSSGATGSGNSLAATVNLAAGTGNSVTFTITGTVSPSALGNLVNTATVTAPAGTTDNNAANNSATDTDTPARVSDLAVTKTDGSATYTPGSPITYTIVVSNAGPSNVTGATLADAVPAAITGVSWTSSVSGNASVSTGATGTGNSLSATLSLGAGAGNSVTFTITGTVSPSATGNLVNTATVTAPAGTTDNNAANNSATDTDTPALVADLAVTKTDGSATYTPGTPITYTLVVTNSGPSNVTGATIADFVPGTITGVSWTSSVSGNASVTSGATGTGNSLSATLSLGAGAGNSVTFTITGTVSPSATGNLVNTATVTAPAGTADNNAANNTATDTDTPAPVADLAITKTDGSPTYTPGSPITYTLVVTNSGPSNVTGATIADAIPAAITGVSWTSSVSGNASVSSGATGSGNSLAATLSLGAGAGNSVTFTITGTVSASATGNLVNTATVSAPPGTADNNAANNSATDTDTPAPVADLAVTKTDGSATYTPGSPITYTIVVSNAGPSNVTGATIADAVPAAITGVSWTSAVTGNASVSSGATGSGNNLAATLSLGAGAGNSVTFIITGTVSPAATGNLVNTATVTAPAGTADNNAANNTATDTDTPALVADLAVTKTDGSATYTPGSPITYTIVVSNAGPSNVTGATLADVIPAAITGVSWSSTTQGTASVSSGATGSGNNLAATVSIPAGAGNSVTFTITGTVSASATGNLVNTATVTAPAGTADNNAANNSATDTDTPALVADLAVTKTDGSATYTPGSPITYTLVVTNSGPSNVTGATIADAVPAAINGVSWTSAVTGNASVSSGATGSGNSLAATINLASGAGNSVTFTITGTVSPSATGNLVNTATVTAPAGTADNNAANNSATDTDTPALVADLAVTKTDGSATYTPGSPITYTIVVSNAGPSNVTGATIADAVPAAITGVSWTSAIAGNASVSSGATGSGNSLAATLSLGAGAGNSVTFTITGTVSPSATGNLVNTATVTAPAGTTDNNAANNSATDTDTPALVADLAVTKTDGSATYTPGSPITYTLVVTNDGPSNVTGATVADAIPAAVTGVSWTSSVSGNASVSSGATGSGNSLAATVNLAAGTGNSVTFTITGTVSPSATGNLVNTATVTAPAGTADNNAANNSATDTDTANPEVDLSITKTDGNTTYTPGTSVIYTVVVSNAGPSNSVGTTVTDSAPTGTTITSWTATFAGGATGTASGNGDLSQTVSLPAGSTITYTITVAVPANYTGNLTNTATVAAPAGTTDLNLANNTATDTDTANPRADLSITKTDGSITYTPGNPVSYTVVVGNSGPSDALGAIVTDNAPSGTAITSWTAVFAGGATGSGSGSGNINQTVSVPSGGSITYTVILSVPSNYTGSLINTATITAPVGVTDPNIANNSATDTDALNTIVDLAITKTDGNITYTPGTTVTYTVEVSNSGPSDATSATVIDNAPSGTTITSWTAVFAGGATGSGSGSGTINQTVNVPAGGNITYTVLVAVPSNYQGNLTNTATITAPAGATDSSPGNNSATDSDTPAPLTDLDISKMVNNSTPQVGSSVTFTLTVNNNGPSAATGVTVNDLLPSGYTFSSSSNGAAYNPGTGVWTIGNLANGATATLTITAVVNPTGNYTNSATVMGNQPDPTPGNNTATNATTPVPVADLVITKTANVTNPNVGTNVTFTLTVSNNGPSAASDVTVLDRLPTGYAYVSDNGGGTYTSSTGIWTIGNLANGASATLNITATVLASGGYANTAIVSAQEFDPNANNNSATASPLPSPVADLVMSKSVTNATPNVGSNVVFTLTVINNGPSAATGVTVLDNLPSGYAYVSDNGSGAYVSSTGAWTIGNLANGGTATLNITATVLAAGSYANTASVSSGETDPTPGNNTATNTPVPVPVVDLSINNTDGVATYTPGTSTTYTVTVTNAGPSNAMGATVTNLAPNGTTITAWTAVYAGGASGSGGGSGDISEVVNVPLGGTITYTVTVAIPSGFTGPLTSTATVAAPAGLTDSNLANNTSTDTDTQNSQADLTLTKTDDSSTYTAGSPVTYTVVVGNTGPSDALGATVNDNAPAGTTITNWTAVFSGGATGTSSGSGNISQAVNLPSGGTITYSVTVAVPANYTGSLANTATVTAPAGVTDPNTANNTATDTDTADPQADLSVTKTDNSPTFTPGVPVNYVVVVSNAGPSNAVGATVTDSAPVGTSITGWSAVFAGGASGTAGGSGTINQIVSIPSGGTITYTITVAVPSDFTGNLTNTATVTAPAGVTDPNAGNNTATDTDIPAPSTNLAITKSVDNSTPNVGSNVTFTLTVSNSGPSNGSGIVVLDPLPSGYEYVSDNGGGTYTSGTGQWNFGSLANGASASLNITVKVLADGIYTNTATVSGNQPDPTPGNNTASNTPVPVPVADLAISKTVDNSTPNVGDNVIFTLTATNNGPSNATGVTVVDQLPPGYAYVSDDGSGSYTNGTGQWTIGSLANGATATLNITATVLATGPYTNTASVSANQVDPVTANNTASNTPVPVPVADLAITITDGSLTYTPGTSVTYTITVTNNGPSTAPGALVANSAPTGTSITSWTALFAGGATGIASGTGNISELVSLPLGASITYSVILAVPSNYTGPLTNTATVNPPSGVTDLDLTNNTATDTDTQNSSTDLAITKSVSLNLPQVGSSATFTLTVTNNGPSAATGVTVTDLLPAGYTYISDNGSGTYNSATGAWAVGNLANGGTASLAIAATVNATGPYLNTATVTGNQTDPNQANNQASAGLQQLQLLPKVYLQGALFGVTFSNPPANTVVDSLMRDELRTKNLIPLTSPYGYWNPTLPDSTIVPAVLTVSGPNAIVDWVFVELRSAADPTVIVSSRSALLQRDGDIVELDGISPIQVRAASSQAYFVAVRHRNHLAVMTASPIALTPSGVVVDFRQPTTPTFVKGPAAIHQAQVVVVQGRAMWAGNALRDNVVIYQGTNNDVNVVAQQVINAPANTFKLPFYILKGYFSGDINMNGEVIFQSTRNDVEFIYQNIIKNHPGNAMKDNFFIIQQQLPE